MNLITLDFETFWAQDFTLRKLTTEEYIRSDKFQIIGVAVKVNDTATTWHTGTHESVKEQLASYPWNESVLICHNTMFDGAILKWILGIDVYLYADTLSMARAIYGIDVGGSLKSLAIMHDIGQKGVEVDDAKGKRLEDFTSQDLAQYGAYCINDVELTYKLFKIFIAKFPHSELSLIDMTLRMFIEPVFKIDDAMLEERLEEVKQEKQQMLSALKNKLGCDSDEAVRKLLASNNKFAGVIEELGVVVPTKISAKTGKKAYALAKTDLGFIELSEHEEPLVQQLCAVRLGTKSTIEESRLERFIGIGQRNRGYLPIPLKYYGAHCVTGNVELLTKFGWERIDSWKGGVIAQVNDKSEIEFLDAKKFTGPIQSEWIEVKGPNIQVQMTLGHTVPYYTETGNWRTIKAGELLNRRSIQTPIAGILTSTGSITKEQMQVLVMVQADGHWAIRKNRKPVIKLKFIKQRKIDRARQLLKEAKIIFSEGVKQANKSVCFYIANKNIPKWLTQERKVFGAWLLDSTPEARTAFIEEISLWDGCRSLYKVLYTSSNKTNVDWADTICHLSNQPTSTSECKNKSGTIQYTLNIKTRRINYTTIKNKHVKENNIATQCYCPETKTGFWLARSNGKIFITGNTGRWSGQDSINAQNLPSRDKKKKALKNSIIADDGYVVINCDSSQIEARVLAWLAGQDDVVEQFAKGEDVYCSFASKVYGKPITKANPIERFVGKTCTLGLGFGTGAMKLQHTLKTQPPGAILDDDECVAIVKLYRDVNDKITDLWKEGDKVIKDLSDWEYTDFVTGKTVSKEPYYYGKHECLLISKEGVLLPNGLSIRYPKLHLNTDESKSRYMYKSRSGMKSIWGGALVENVVQALARIIVGEQMVLINERYKVALTVHDAAVCVVREEEVEEAMAYIIDIMSTPPAWAKGLPITCEAGFGKSYGDC